MSYIMIHNFNKVINLFLLNYLFDIHMHVYFIIFIFNTSYYFEFK